MALPKWGVFASKPSGVSEIAMAVFSFTIAVMGTVGNSLALLVMTGKTMRQLPMSFYLAALSCADTSVLWVSTMYLLDRAMNHESLLNTSAATCKWANVAYYTAYKISNWIVVVISLDRFLAVWFPQTNRLCSVNVAKLTVMLIVMVAFGDSLRYYWMRDVNVITGIEDAYKTVSMCMASEKYKEFTSTIDPWIIGTICWFGPLAMIMMFNILTLIRLCQIGILPGEREDSTDRRMVVMALAISIMFLALNVPQAVSHILAGSYKVYQYEVLGFWNYVVLSQSNHALNFVVYCACSNTFRGGLNQLVKERFPCPCFKRPDIRAAGDEQNNEKHKKKVKKAETRTASPVTIKTVADSVI